MNEKLKISCPCNNIVERRYVVDILLGRFLNLDYVISFDGSVDAYVISKAGKKLVVEDHFFCFYPKALSYLTVEALPSSLSWFEVEYYSKKLPIIYGQNKLVHSSDSVVCGLDIFASSFFMLTRWEEYVLGRNEKGKCDEDMLFCVRQGIYQRPVVNEYIELLTTLLKYLDCSTHASLNFSVKITHDVDRVYLSGWKEMLTNAFHLFSQGMGMKAWTLLRDYCWYKLFMPHPFDTFESFRNLSEKYGFKDEFYFKACEKGEKGYTYSCDEPIVVTQIKKIVSRGHMVGYHPSETTFKNHLQFELEVGRLKKVASNVVNGRNHGLYFSAETYRDWMDLAFEAVSNYGFQKRCGFRCGICYPFPVFDVFERKTFSVVEYPFLLMDTVLLRTMPDLKTAFSEMTVIIDIVKYYGGIVCVNWHTNVYNMRKMMKYKGLYEKVLAYVGKQMD